MPLPPPTSTFRDLVALEARGFGNLGVSGVPAVLSWSARGARCARAPPYFHSYVCLLIWSVCWSVGLPGLSRLSGYSSLPCWSDLSGGSLYLVGRIYWVVGLSIGRSVWFVWLVCLLVYWSTCWSVRLLVFLLIWPV